MGYLGRLTRVAACLAIPLFVAACGDSNAPMGPGLATDPTPADGAAGVGLTPTLTWTGPSGATSYDVYLSTNLNEVQGTTTSVAFQESVSTPGLMPAATLERDTLYYWRVDSRNARAASMGTIWSFRTSAEPLPGQVVITAPLDGAMDVAVDAQLTWNAASNASSYDVYVGVDREALLTADVSSAAFLANVTGTSFDLAAAISYDATFYIRVDARNSSGATVGTVQSFTTANRTQAPNFTGIQSASAISPNVVALTWWPANDDRTASSDLVYEVFAATGAIDFSSPLLSTSPGATSVILTTAELSSLAAGASHTFAVRVRDPMGNVDDNETTITVTQPAAADVIYVDVAAAGPGNGSLADPFTTIQAGVDAAEAADGGTLVIAQGSYTDRVSISVDITGEIVLRGGFPTFATAADTTPAGLLGARDPIALATVLDDSAVIEGGTPAGFMTIANGGSPVELEGITFTEHADAAIVATDATLRVIGSRFTDGDGDNLPESAIRLVGAMTPSALTLTGTVIERSNYGVQLGGLVGVLDVRGNDFHALEDDILRGHTEVAPGDFQMRFTVPTGAGSTIVLTDNISNDTESLLDSDVDPQDPTMAGDLTVDVLRNRLFYCNSGDWIEMLGVGQVGRGGTAAISVEDNYLRGSSSGTVDLDLVRDVIVDPLAHNDFSFAFRRNTVIHIDSDSISVRQISVAPNVQIAIAVEDNFFSHMESDVLDLATIEGDFAVDGAGSGITIDFNRNLVYGSDEGIQASPLDPGVGGSLMVNVMENRFPQNYSGLFDLRSTGFIGDPTAADPSGTRVFRIIGNHALGESDRNEIDIAPAGDAGYARLEVVDNHLPVLDSDILDIQLAIDANEALNRYDVASGQLDIVVFNANLNDGDNDALRLTGEYPEGMTATFFGSNISGIGGYESESVDVFTRAPLLALLTRSEFGFNDVDSSEGIRLFGNAGSDFTISNVVVAHAAGEGIDAQSIVPQIYNVTLHANSNYGNEGGIGCTPVTIGVDEAPYCQMTVLNSIVVDHAVTEGDFELENIFEVSYNLTSDGTAPAGMNNIEGDAAFRGGTDVRDIRNYYQLAAHSDAIDAGHPDPRYRDTDGSRNDMGFTGGPMAGTIGYLGAGVRDVPMAVVGLTPLTHPYSGMAQAPADAPITVTFTNDVDAATVSANNIQVSRAGLPVAGTFTTRRNRVTFTPSAPLAPGDIVDVVVSNVQDTNGQALAWTHWDTFFITPVTVPEAEPNDDVANATALNQAAFGYTGDVGVGDVDRYTFTATEGQVLMLSTFSARFGATGVAIVLEIRAADGTLLDLGRDNFGHYGPADPTITYGEERDPYVQFTAPADGTYTVVVREATDLAASYTLVGYLQ